MKRIILNFLFFVMIIQFAYLIYFGISNNDNFIVLGMLFILELIVFKYFIQNKNKIRNTINQITNLTHETLKPKLTEPNTV